MLSRANAINPMKKRRRTFWRWLLALLLGAGTWWGMGWWLYPKPYLHIQRSIFPEKIISPDQKSKKSDEPEIEALGERNFIVNRASILDTAGKYLYIEEAHAPGPRHYEVIDLQTKQTIARHVFAELKDAWHLEDDSINLASPNGIKHFLCEWPVPEPEFIPEKKVTQKGNVTYTVLKDRPIRIGRHPTAPQLWEWDVLKNENKLLRKYSQDTTIKISYDGRTMLEIERVTPIMPALFLPVSLPNVLSSLVEKELHCNDVAVMRFWSLPQLALRSAVVLSWMDRQANAELSSDGAYLIIPDAEAPKGFTSPKKVMVHSGFYSPNGRGGGNVFTGGFFDRELYASSPLGLRVFNTRNGQLWWEKTDHSGFYSNCDTESATMIRFTASGSREGASHPNILLHLLSRQITATSLCTSIARLDDQRTHSMQIDPFDLELGFEIVITDQNGNSEHLPKQGLDGKKLLPNGPQYLKEQQSSYYQLLPDWFADWMVKQNLLVNWLKEEWRTLQVNDYANKRVLWTRRSHNHLSSEITDYWLLISEQDNGMFILSVYALPFPSWSPWWARSAGIIVLLIALYLLRQRQPRRG